jgi:hypothetical protein
VTVHVAPLRPSSRSQRRSALRKLVYGRTYRHPLFLGSWPGLRRSNQGKRLLQEPLAQRVSACLATLALAAAFCLTAYRFGCVERVTQQLIDSKLPQLLAI